MLTGLLCILAVGFAVAAAGASVSPGAAGASVSPGAEGASVSPGAAGASGEVGSCPSGCECGVAEGELEYTCRAGATTFSVRALPNDFARIFCQDGHLSCEDMPFLRLSNNGTLSSLGVRACGAVRVRCVLARLAARHVRALTVRGHDRHDGHDGHDRHDGHDAGILRAEHLAGLDRLETLTLLEADGYTSIPYDVISALPSLRDFRLHDASLRLEAPPPSASRTPHPSLKYVALVSDHIDGLPANSLQGLKGVQQIGLWNNKIRNLTSDSFLGMESLLELDLSRNPFQELPPGVFTNAPLLTKLKLVATDLVAIRTDALTGLQHLQELLIKFCQKPLTFESRALAALPSLKKLTIDRCKPTLPADLLTGDENLEQLDITMTNLEELPPGIFAGLKSLKTLNLNNNKLRELSVELFWPLQALAQLNLNDNKIEVLPGKLFAGLKNLVTLTADNNRIKTIYPNTFQGAVALETVSLAANQLTLELEDGSFQYADVERQSPFNGLFKMKQLILRDNSISQMMSDWRLVLVANLKNLDLSGNNFTELTKADIQFLSNDIVVDLRRNKITSIDVFEAPEWLPQDELMRDHTDGIILLDDNPFNCDCELFMFIRRLHGSRPLASEPLLDPGQARCHSPPSLSGRLLKQLSPTLLTCSFRPEDCPTNCTCDMRPATYGLELDCEQELLKYPNPSDFGLKDTKLRLRQAPVSLAILPDHIKAVNLTGVGLSEVTDLSSAIEYLDLSNNNLKYVPSILDSNLTVYLANNPFVCDCSHSNDVVLLQKNAEKIIDYKNVTCSGGSFAWRVDATRLCDVRRATALGGALAAIGLVAIIIAALMYRYKLEIKVFLFSRGWCMCLLREEELEGDARYDAFVSFSQQDAKWVVEELMPKLEGEHCLRLCVHYRDWDVGEMIPEQITRSVEESRRTIVVLSEHFLKSLWAPLEFRAAHLRAQRERRTRVLVIILGELPKQSEMDDELRAYLNTNTYLKWGDPWFWEKLVYALPHTRSSHAVLPDKLQRGALDIRLNAEGKIVNDAAPAL